jgi:hypothetical protein
VPRDEFERKLAYATAEKHGYLWVDIIERTLSDSF